MFNKAGKTITIFVVLIFILLFSSTCIGFYLYHLEERLHKIYDGFIVLKNKGYAVDAISPQSAIYLTIKFELTGKKTSEGKILQTQADVNSYILNEAKIAVVPFYAFGASKESPWYRLSVGTCKKEEMNLPLANCKQQFPQAEKLFLIFLILLKRRCSFFRLQSDIFNANHRFL